MSRWSSFKSQQVLTENWRKFLQEEDDEPEGEAEEPEGEAEESEEEAQVVYGLTSQDNPESLKRMLAGVVEDNIAAQIINLIASAAEDEGVMLEAVSLQGSKSEQDRVFSGETTREILQGLVSLNLGAAKLKNVIKVLNQWGKLNTVKFEKPAAASAPAASPAPAPAEPPPETPTLAPDSEPDDFEEEPTEEVPRFNWDSGLEWAPDDEEDTQQADTDDEYELFPSDDPYDDYRDREDDAISQEFDRFFDRPDNYDELVGTDTRGKKITSGGVFEAIGEALTGIDYIERKYSDYQIVKEFVTKSKSMFNQAGDFYDDGEYLDAIKKLYELGNYVADEYERPGGAISVVREMVSGDDHRKLNQAVRQMVPYDISGDDE